MTSNCLSFVVTVHIVIFLHSIPTRMHTASKWANSTKAILLKYKVRYAKNQSNLKLKLIDNNLFLHGSNVPFYETTKCLFLESSSHAWKFEACSLKFGWLKYFLWEVQVYLGNLIEQLFCNIYCWILRQIDLF